MVCETVLVRNQTPTSPLIPVAGSSVAAGTTGSAALADLAAAAAAPCSRRSLKMSFRMSSRLSRMVVSLKMSVWSICG